MSGTASTRKVLPFAEMLTPGRHSADPCTVHMEYFDLDAACSRRNASFLCRCPSEVAKLLDCPSIVECSPMLRAFKQRRGRSLLPTRWSFCVGFLRRTA